MRQIEIILLEVAALVVLIVAIQNNNLPLKITALGIGQGDAILLHKGSLQILIDGGPDDKVLRQVGKYMPFYDHSIDLLVLTHPDADHVTGLVFILEKYDVKEILYSKQNFETEVSQAFLQKAGEKNIKIECADADDRYEFSGGSIDVLFPFFEEQFVESVEDRNDTSVVARACGENQCVMLTGDATSKVEKELIESGENLEAEILKLGHHGSKSSTSGEFLLKVHPRSVIISVGENNRYKHPSTEVLELLEKYNLEVKRTDLEGDISFSL